VDDLDRAGAAERHFCKALLTRTGVDFMKKFGRNLRTKVIKSVYYKCVKILFKELFRAIEYVKEFCSKWSEDFSCSYGIQFTFSLLILEFKKI
jgi:hypothetical protein